MPFREPRYPLFSSWKAHQAHASPCIPSIPAKASTERQALNERGSVGPMVSNKAFILDRQTINKVTTVTREYLLDLLVTTQGNVIPAPTKPHERAIKSQKLESKPYLIQLPQYLHCNLWLGVNVTHGDLSLTPEDTLGKLLISQLELKEPLG